MSLEQTEKAADLGFDVEIRSGGRAYEGNPQPEARAVSPTRAAAKAHARRRNFIIAGVVAVLLLAAGTWAYVSNPNTNIPEDAVARVNGDFIYQRDIQREIDLTRASYYMSKSENAEVPGAGAILEELISRKMQAQDAVKAGVIVTAQDVDNELGSILGRIGKTQSQLGDALSRYNLTLDDMRLIISDRILINKYKAIYVIGNATAQTDINNKVNDWETSLAQTSKVERLKAPGAGEAPRVGSQAPDFTLKDMSGKTVKLSSLRGRPVMLNFWATWCPPCRAEIPTIVQTYADTHKSEGAYQILGIATQSEGTTVEAFAKELNINFPVLPDADNKVTEMYHVLPIPTSFFLDKDGIIRDMQVGIVDRPKMEKWLLTP